MEKCRRRRIVEKILNRQLTNNVLVGSAVFTKFVTLHLNWCSGSMVAWEFRVVPSGVYKKCKNFFSIYLKLIRYFFAHKLLTKKSKLRICVRISQTFVINSDLILLDGEYLIADTMYTVTYTNTFLKIIWECWLKGWSYKF